ncbi:hypothetical protein ACU4GD_43045 [Cupriavidus basilensis]
MSGNGAGQRGVRQAGRGLGGVEQDKGHGGKLRRRFAMLDYRRTRHLGNAYPLLRCGLTYITRINSND